MKLVTRVGSGLWVAFDGECTLNLYYLETLMRLQEVNLSRIIRDFVQGLWRVPAAVVADSVAAAVVRPE